MPTMVKCESMLTKKAISATELEVMEQQKKAKEEAAAAAAAATTTAPQTVTPDYAAGLMAPATPVSLFALIC